MADKTRKPSARARRSAARLAAVQALYQIEQTGVDREAVLGEFVAYRFGMEEEGDRYVAPDPALFGAIVRGVGRRSEDIERLIAAALTTERGVARLELPLRAILRAGAWELLENDAADVPLVIAEYLNLGHAFFSGREPAIVNAVLDRIARVVRPALPTESGEGA